MLYIYIHPAFVDVNVHPTKLEVKFSNERSIFDAVYCAVKNALAEHRRDGETDVMLQPKHVGGEKYDAVNAFVPVYDRIVSGGKPKTEQASIFDNAVYGEKIETAETLAGLNADKKDTETPKTPFWDISFGGDTVPAPSVPLYENVPKAEEKKYLFSISDVTETQVTSRDEKKYKILGVAFNAYIFVENDGKVMVIDKHAAHERILFEDMKKILYASESHSQTLLVPESVSLSSEELGAVNEYENEIKSLGFEFETDGKEILIRSIPTVISPSDAKDMIVTIAGQIASGTGSESVTRNITFEKALYQASCKAAMKAGIVDNDANTKFIVDRLFEIPDIKYCPHGRPCTFELSELELEKRFKRT